MFTWPEPGELGRDRAKRSPLACLGIAPAQALHQGDQLRLHLQVRPAALAFAIPSPLAIPSGLQLGDQARLLELGDGAEHLADQNGGRRVLSEKVRGRRRDEVDPQPFQHVVAGELDGQVTSKAIRALDDDRPDPIAGDPLQHGQEAGALGHGIGAAHRRVIELGLDRIAIRHSETHGD